MYTYIYICVCVCLHGCRLQVILGPNCWSVFRPPVARAWCSWWTTTGPDPSDPWSAELLQHCMRNAYRKPVKQWCQKSGSARHQGLHHPVLNLLLWLINWRLPQISIRPKLSHKVVKFWEAFNNSIQQKPQKKMIWDPIMSRPAKLSVFLPSLCGFPGNTGNQCFSRQRAIFGGNQWYLTLKGSAWLGSSGTISFLSWNQVANIPVSSIILVDR